MKAWKNAEIRFAKELGLMRVQRTIYSDSEPDCYNRTFILESKSRKQGFPKLIADAFAQVHKYNERLYRLSGIYRTELVGLHKNGSRDYFIVIRLEDFEEIIKKAGML